MGLMDAIAKSGLLDQLGGGGPVRARAAGRLWRSAGASGGGGTGLNQILQGLQSSGLGDVVASWLGSGSNQAVSPSQLQSALGDQTVSQFANKAGIDTGAALTALAGMLPQLVDSLSPDGSLPESNQLESLLSKALSA